MLDLSLAQMQAAWERVRENAGCAGVDGVIVERYEHQAAAGLPELRAQAQDGSYRPLPLRKVVIEKRPGVVRSKDEDLEARAARLRTTGRPVNTIRTLLVPAVKKRRRN